ncbi:hypothetical protein JW926_18430 [Candidatus Sumerlaeota bacterium]|nr:hypothetical protein [Candidatus Sumerlaeota bacterium]
MNLKKNNISGQLWILLFSSFFLYPVSFRLFAGEITYIDLKEGTSAMDASGRFLFGYDFGSSDESIDQKIGDIRFKQISSRGGAAYCGIFKGTFHPQEWNSDFFMPPVKKDDPLVKILQDLVYKEPEFILCKLTPGNEYKLQILIRYSGEKRLFRIAFTDGDSTDTTPELNEGDGRAIPSLDLPEKNWAAAIAYEWKAQTDIMTINVHGDDAHIYGMTLEDISGGHVMVDNPLCQEEEILSPEDFPSFHVPGLEKEMEILEKFFIRHYLTHIRGCTLWQDWMTFSTLWPSPSAHHPDQYNYRRFHHDFLLNADIDDEGCVATHQHASFAHRDGWPFPSFEQSMGKGAGWVRGGFDGNPGWTCEGAKGEFVKDKELWILTPEQLQSYILSPELNIDSSNAPYMELRWRRETENGGDPYMEWTTEDSPDFSPARRMYFTPAENDRGKYGFSFACIPLFRHPQWSGTIKRIRIFPAPLASSGKIEINAFMTQYDTRHTINNSNFILGCRNYFTWSGDLVFLRKSLPRMRTAMRWLQKQAGGLKHGCILDPLPGHDGRPGYSGEPGERKFYPGRGVGSNYWDILPFGGWDCYSSNYYYKSLLALAEIEESVSHHPEWNIPRGVESFDPVELRLHSKTVRETIQEKFWNKDTGRFVGWIDLDGKAWDYGFTFLNLELIESGVASDKQAQSILDWISGNRIINGDTSTGEDIYKFRLAPRATTKRNIECYQWVWQCPECLEFGYQVQDGGAVLGFSYHDLASRLKILGADNAWERFREILEWDRETQDAGGYRAYYANGDKGTTLQGGGTAGGIGIDFEFIESILAPQIMLYGFLGLNPQPDRIEISPNLPSGWDFLKIENISYQDIDMDIRAGGDEIEIKTSSSVPKTLRVDLPGENWSAVSGDAHEQFAAGFNRQIFLLPVSGKSMFQFKKE